VNARHDIRTSLGLMILFILVGCSGKGSRAQPGLDQAPEPEPRPRVIVVGVDGLDPEILERLIAAKKLPNLARLHRSPLLSVTPADPLCAWGSVVTGAPPSSHGLVGDRTRRAGSVAFADGLAGGDFEERDSALAVDPFWTTLSNAGMDVRVLRAPASFPPPKGDRLELLSGMGTPDVNANACQWILVSSTPRPATSMRGGVLITATSVGASSWEAVLPAHVGEQDTFAARITIGVVAVDGESPLVSVDGGNDSVSSAVGKWSDWFGLIYEAAGQSYRARTRMLALRAGKDIEIFLEPPGVDPFSPHLPVTSPRYLAGFYADRYGPYRTCGTAVDETAFAAGVIGPAALIGQAYMSWEQQGRMTLGEVARDDWDVLVTIFGQPDAPVRIFSRATDPGMPAHDPALAETYGDAVEKMYGQLDSLVGELLKSLGPADRIIVLSARGERTVRREFNLTSWLAREGYLVLAAKAKSSKRDELADVDWTKTRAYSSGAGGIYLNLAGREPFGIVEPGARSDALLAEISTRLGSFTEGASPVVKEVLSGADLFAGSPATSPDLLVVLEPGYGISADSYAGAVPASLLVDSTGAWIPAANGGDPVDAAGVLLTTLPPAGAPTVLDVAPTILHVMGVKPPPTCVGKSFW
jgi:predicted AlkP superfamily phosphohydrolase/phosphomutase